MKKNPFLSFSIQGVLLMLLSLTGIKAQSIQAGMHSGNDYYKDFNPDTSNAAVHNGAGAQFYFDLNGDGHNDFLLTGSNGGGLGGNTASTTLNPLDSNEIAFGHYDSCWGFTGFIYATAIPESYALGQPIDSTANWVKTALTLSNNSYVMNSYNCSAGISGPVYLGLRIFLGNDTLYGWINLPGIGSGSYTVAELACNTGPAKINAKSKTAGIKISPNPAREWVTIQFCDSGNFNRIKVTDALGRTVFSEDFQLINQYTIPVSNWQNGYYNLRLINEENQIFNYKLIIYH